MAQNQQKGNQLRERRPASVYANAEALSTEFLGLLFFFLIASEYVKVILLYTDKFIIQMCYNLFNYSTKQEINLY